MFNALKPTGLGVIGELSVTWINENGRNFMLAFRWTRVGSPFEYLCYIYCPKIDWFWESMATNLLHRSMKVSRSKEGKKEERKYIYVCKLEKEGKGRGEENRRRQLLHLVSLDFVIWAHTHGSLLLLPYVSDHLSLVI